MSAAEDRVDGLTPEWTLERSRKVERERLQSWARSPARHFIIDGAGIWLRPLTGLDTIAIRDITDPGRQGLATVALSLALEDGERLWPIHDLEKGIAAVGDWPEPRVVALTSSIAAINGQTEDEDAFDAARRD